MTDRERLVEHIGAFCKGELGANLKKDILEKFADHILADGWIRPPFATREEAEKALRGGEYDA